MDDLVILAHAASPRGEVLLRRRSRGDDTVDELIVNGSFAMDSSETSSERSLAHLVINRAAAGARILVGGLGLGYTAAEILADDVGEVVVVELEEALIRWANDGVTRTLAQVAADPRVRLVTADVAAWLTRTRPEHPWDGIVLDVDNGPDFLIHRENAGLYSRQVLSAAYEGLAAGGRLAIWCQGEAPALLEVLRSIHPDAQQHVYRVTRGRRQLSYAIYTLDRPLVTALTPG